MVINTGVAGTPQYNAGPVYRSSASSAYDASRYVYLYTAEELAAVGIGSGANIISLGWMKNNTATTTGGGIMRIYLKNSSAASFSQATETWANLNSGAVLVYENLNQEIPATASPNYITFNMTAPFVYTGGSMEISVEWDANQITGNPSTAAFDWMWSTVNARIYGTGQTVLANAGTLSSTTNSISAIDNRRPFIQITYGSSAACTSPPTAGTATASAAAVCTGTPVVFALTGNSFGTGQTYQWQSSSSASGPYTNIGSSQTSPGTTFNATTGVTYYRSAVTCGGNTTYSAPVAVTGYAGLPAGTYTINSTAPTAGSNFNNFTDVITALSCGIQGPVVFNVTTVNATYNEQVILPEIAGASATNTITFNGNGNTLAFASANTNERATIKLNGADHVTIDSLNIVASAGTYGFGIHLINGADSNTIRRCTIDAGVTATSTNFAGIAISGSATSATTAGSLSDGNLIENNTVRGGYYGITIMGTTTAGNQIQNNTVRNNKVTDFYYYGIYSTGTNKLVIEGNDLERPTRTAGTTVYMVYYTGVTTGTRLSANRLHNPYGSNQAAAGDVYVVYMTGADAVSGNENIASNNLIYDMNGGGLIYCFYNASSDYIRYYHNTISVDRPGFTSTDLIRGFYQTTLAAGIEYKNNIVTLNRGGTGAITAIYMNTATTTFVSNNNNFFVNGSSAAVGYFNATSLATLADWKTATTQDAASVSLDPQFLDPNSGFYFPNNAALDNLGTPVGITTDITGATRSTTTPDIGAYEFAPVGCVNPPVPGTVTTSQSPVCTGTTFTLGFTGGSIGAGLTYQWQRNTGSGWTDIAGATNTTLSLSQAVTTSYRITVSCNGNTPVPSASLEVITPPGMAGNYTINSGVATGGTNFQSFTEAYNALRCGISAAVVLDVVTATGPYNEQLLMEEIPGASSVNTVTFRGNGNTLAFAAPTTADRAVIRFNGTDHVTIQDLTIVAGTSSATYGWGIHLTNSADSNTIRNCTINIEVTSTTAANSAGIVFSNSGTSPTTSGDPNCDGNTVDNNTITGGYYGMSMMANSGSAFNSWNKITRNKIRDYYIYGLYVNGAFDVLVDSNVFERPNRAGVSTHYGIYFTGVSASAKIYRNIIRNPFGAAPTSTSVFYGIYFSNVDALAARENVVANNLIYNLTGNGSVYGIYNSGSDLALYYHNTIHLDGASTGTSDVIRGFYQTTAASDLQLRNNMFTISRENANATKFALYLNEAATSITSNNNNFYYFTSTGDNHVGYVGASNYTTLASWQAATGKDANSYSNDPLYVNVATGNLEPSNAGINDRGVAVVPAIPVDIRGTARSATTPDIGAFEFAPPACVTPPTPGVAAVTETPVCENSLVTLSLDGQTTGDGQTYQWEASTTINGTYAPVSGVLTNPSFTVTATSSFYYRCVVTCSGNSATSTPVLLAVNPALPGGTYVIDQNGGGDYLNFTEVKAALACGITGPVVFNVESMTGPYVEQFLLDTIPGSSAVNTITFNGNGNTIQFSSSASDARSVIGLRRTDYVTFDNLVIDATGTGTYGWGVFMTNNADNNTFRNCRIILNNTATSTNFAGIVISSSATGATTSGATFCDNNLFENNEISGGYYGITQMGVAATPSVGNRFIGNKITDFYSYGIYAGISTNLVIQNNIINRLSRTGGTTFYGIYHTGTSNNSLISGNRIHSPFTGAPTNTSAMYGIYLTANDAPSNAPTRIVNNLLYDFNGAGTIYGFYNSSSNNARYLHNTLSFDNTANTSTSVTYGSYQVTEADGIQLRNNIITISRGGTGAKHGMYFSTALTSFTSDNNNVLVNGAAGVNNFGYASGAAQATLAAWQATTSQDANSLTIDPIYTSPGAGNFRPTQATLDDKGSPAGVLNDIEGAPRSTTTPDPGAYEFVVIPCTAPPTAGAAAASPASGLCLGSSIQLTLNGNSTGGFQRYVWQIADNPGGPWTDISDSLYSPEFEYTLQSTAGYFRAVVVCGTGVANSTSVQINFNPMLMAGDYTIDPAVATGGTNFQTFNEAVAAMQCGITGSVRFHAVPGSYNEQVRIPKIYGANENSTITFMSQNGDPASVTLTYSGTAANNYTLLLDSAVYVTFRNMTIVAQSATNGRAVQFAASAAYDSIVNCVINVPASSSTSTTVVGVFGETLTGSDLVVKGNTITNGSSGVYLSGSTTNVPVRVSIDSNKVNGSYYYGIYAGNINKASVYKNTITRTGVQNTSSYGIYSTNCDSAYRISNNRIDIISSGVTTYGIYLTGNQAAANAKGDLSNNKVIASGTSTGNQYGIYVTSCTYAKAANNVVSVKTSGATAYGIYSTGTGGIRYYNNTVQNASTSVASTTNIAGYFSQTSGTAGQTYLVNNIFSHTNGGWLLDIANPRFIYSDYNMFYTSGTTLIRTGTTNVPNLDTWRNTAAWDLNSIVYQPAFSAASDDLQPDLASPNVWAIHGRGVQMADNATDINGNDRPTTLTAGVPDLGAYEFLPTSTPVALTAIPATPVANTTQVFMLGTDTVTKISWGSVVPSTVTGRRYSGVQPPSLAPGQNYMYFYTDFDHTGTAPTGHKVEQFYIDSWQGYIARQSQVKLGRTNASNTWEVSATSTVDDLLNVIREENLTTFDKYTGLTDGTTPPPPPIVLDPSEASNTGTQFWVGYGHQYYMTGNNSQELVLYLGAGATPANVTVRVFGTPFIKTYTVPANTVIASDFMPKQGLYDSRLLEEGLSDKGISIQSDQPITAYAHIYSSASSGATMLMPTGTYGYEYYALTSRQAYTGDSYSWFYVVAAYDSTVVQITPSNPTRGGRSAGEMFTVRLNKGEVYQVIGEKFSTNQGYDMTGSIVKSVANENGKCYPIAMFSGSGRTAIGCTDGIPTLNGDNIIQQNFPYRAWGKRYLTAPTSSSATASTMHTNIFKVSVKDPTTEVKVNGVVQTNLIDGRYYQFNTNQASYIEADKPIMVAQFMSSTSECGNPAVLDPEMIYISPIEQGINKVALYRNTQYAITVQYLTLIIPSNGVNSLTIDGSNTFDYVYDHVVPGYKVVVKRWAATRGQTFVQSDSAFTAITYGLGSVESYGYNAGTAVRNLFSTPSLTNVFNPNGASTPYTCKGTPFRLTFQTSVKPTQIEWLLSQVPQLTPHADSIQTNPTPADSVLISGTWFYQYTLQQDFVASQAGEYNLPIFITHPDIDGCNARMETNMVIRVLETPAIDFTVTGNCVGNAVQFNGTASTANGTPIGVWNWNFDDNGATANTQNPTHTYAATGTYDVAFNIIAQDGCIAKVTKEVQVGAGPAVVITPDSLSTCVGSSVTFNVQNPVTGATYRWYASATSSTVLHTGNSWTITNVTGPVSYFVESSLNGCISQTRKEVKITILPALATPVAVVDFAGTNEIRFRWEAITNATGYEVTTDGGTTWTIPSSGATGLTHTITGLQTGQSVTLRVRALGGCLPAVSLPVTGTTVTDEVFVPNTFTPNNDGRNDELKIYGNSIRELHAVVFNQWGEKIAEVKNPGRDGDGGYRVWNGTHKNKPQPSGVYMYVIDVTLNDGTRIQRKGAVNLLR
ncbi:right-handed parallel beta-helix repeat-containing protein [Nostoc ellipsosporum NOK]|nr:right-handed parallel beta-helix repeat-containing protein [Nostoc ellipsosporum NOK]